MNTAAKQDKTPLAESLRPKQWQDFAGLSKIDKNLISQIQKGIKPPSLIIWGPAGTGKTTLAKLIGQSIVADFVELSAVLSGVKDIREVIEQAKQSQKNTLLFVDEIHRFNKSQQDAFLPHLEAGTITLIGATTENPSFYLTSALLSRSRVVVLQSLEDRDLVQIFERATKLLEIQTDQQAQSLLVKFAAGDARRLLNLLEHIANSFNHSNRVLTFDLAKEFLESSKTLFYDRDGEEHYNIASAFIKSMRGSDADAALYWGFRMLEAGEDPRFIIRRMMIFASEDIGNADPRALQLAVATFDAFEKLGLPEGKIPIAHCITYLATAPKSNRSYLAMHAALDAIKQQTKVAVPLHLRNAPTKLMKDLNYSVNYQYPHDNEIGFVKEQYLPDQIKHLKFYQPKESGYERTIKERLEYLKKETK